MINITKVQMEALKESTAGNILNKKTKIKGITFDLFFAKKIK